MFRVTDLRAIRPGVAAAPQCLSGGASQADLPPQDRAVLHLPRVSLVSTHDFSHVFMKLGYLKIKLLFL